jgi:hypothetical protein
MLSIRGSISGRFQIIPRQCRSHEETMRTIRMGISGQELSTSTKKAAFSKNQQLDFEKEKEKKIAIYKLPWKEWCLHKDGLGAMEADKASAVAVLHALHERFDVASQSIEVLHNEKENRTFVVAACKVAANAIVLPPCVPKQSKVLDRTDHPYAVKMIMHVMRSTEASVKSQAGNILRVRTFFVLPEFKIPEKKQSNTAVAVQSTLDPEWIWSEVGGETMHPFWAVRRLTEKQLARERSQVRLGQLLPRFNCELRNFSLSSVSLAIIGLNTLNRTKLLGVPFLTNVHPLEACEELILEVVEKTKEAKPVKRSWRDAVKDDEKATAKNTKMTNRMHRNAVAGAI